LQFLYLLRPLRLSHIRLDRQGVAHIAEAVAVDGVTAICLDNCGLGDEELLPLYQVSLFELGTCRDAK
jgi:hypothetical protein